jgi:hypothetical protein
VKLGEVLTLIMNTNSIPTEEKNEPRETNEKRKWRREIQAMKRELDIE